MSDRPTGPIDSSSVTHLGSAPADMSRATVRIEPKTIDRHRGVKYTLHVPTELDDRLANLKPEPMPRTRMVLIALKHYLDDCRAYGIDARTLLPRTPPRPHVPTPDEIMDQEEQHEAR